MAESARITLTGRLGRDPEIRYTPSGSMNVLMSVAVTRKWKDRGGMDQSNTTWFRVTAWKDLATQLDELVQRGSLKKGQEVRVTGSIEQRQYQDAQGQTRYSLDVMADEVNDCRQTFGAQAVAAQNQQMDFSDVPF